MVNARTLAAGLRALPGCRVQADVPLRELSRWRIGGPADWLVEPQHAEAAAGALRLLAQSGVPTAVIGDGSNLLFDDAGLRGVVLRIGRAMSRVDIAGTCVHAEAGAWTPQLARRVGSAGLSGIEHTVGIPGTLGGLVVMNGGSLRHGIGEVLTRVRALDAEGRLHTLSQADCAFAYRRSALQQRGLLVVDASFELQPGDARAIRREMRAIMAARRRKFPLRLPNCGSVFLSDPAMYERVGPPGQAIEQAGLRGTRVGDAQIAPGHGNFIVNLGRARSADVLALIRLAREAVHRRTGFHMDCEVRHLAPDGRLRPAHEAADEAAAALATLAA